MGLFDALGSIFTSSGTGTAWSGLGNTKAKDALYATTTVALGASSTYLKTTGYQFMIPMDSNVTGIQVERFSKSSGVGSITDFSVRLYKGDVLVGDDKADGTTAWGVTDSSYVYGGPGDIWGITWMPWDINASGFGVGIQVKGLLLGTASVNYVGVTVFYEGSNKVSTSDTGHFKSENGMSNSGAVW